MNRATSGVMLASCCVVVAGCGCLPAGGLGPHLGGIMQAAGDHLEATEYKDRMSLYNKSVLTVSGYIAPTILDTLAYYSQSNEELITPEGAFSVILAVSVADITGTKPAEHSASHFISPHVPVALSGCMWNHAYLVSADSSVDIEELPLDAMCIVVFRADTASREYLGKRGVQYAIID